MRIIYTLFVLIYVVLHCEASHHGSYTSLGCWGDKWSPRAIEGKAIKVSKRHDGLQQCADHAERQGFTVFALQYNEWCFTHADAEQTYKKYGERTNCHKGRGGTYANSVYSLKAPAPQASKGDLAGGNDEDKACTVISMMAMKLLKKENEQLKETMDTTISDLKKENAKMQYKMEGLVKWMKNMHAKTESCCEANQPSTTDKPLKKCPLEFKFPKPCIQLEPPKEVNAIITKCWSEAIDTDFQCQDIGQYFMDRYTSGNKEPMSIYDFIFIDSFSWLVYFTDDISPNLCPLLKTETRKKIKTSFRSCFLNQTGLEMGKMINVQQVITQLGNYIGSENNKTAVIKVAEDCSKKSDNQEDFSKCATKELIGTCMRDPYFEKPTFPFMPDTNEGGPPPPPPSPVTRGYGGKPGSYGGKPGGYGGKPGGYGGKPGGYGGKPMCEPCIPLEATDEVTMAWKTCMDDPEAQDFYHKFLKCLKWEPKGDKPMEAMWPQLFTPRFKLSVFFDKESQDAHTDCTYQKLGLGSSTEVNPQGFRDLVNSKLIGEQKDKDNLIETIDACSTGTEAITSEEFTTCTVQRLQKQCGMQ